MSVRFPFSLVAALFATVPAVSLADDPVQKTGVNAATVAGEGPADAQAKAMAAPSYTDFVSSYSTKVATNLDLSDVDDKSVVNITNISSLEGFKDDTALNAAMKTNSAALDEMHKLIASNTTLTAKLKAAGLIPENVVLIENDPSPAINVFVKDSTEEAGSDAAAQPQTTTSPGDSTTGAAPATGPGQTTTPAQ